MKSLIRSSKNSAQKNVPFRLDKEMRELEVRKVARRRKRNFSVNKITVVTESVRRNLEIIQSKLTNSITSKRKTDAWEGITRDVDSVGQENRTIQEVKDEQKNLHSIARKEFLPLKETVKKLVVDRHQSHLPSQANKYMKYLKTHPLFSACMVLKPATTKELVSSMQFFCRCC